ncbi:MAG: TVP38/TMEM64 family protein [Acidobacteriota bacterium]|nr:TVP38/TMEM64 family protein [Acidobacteriota bacterium]
MASTPSGSAPDPQAASPSDETPAETPRWRAYAGIILFLLLILGAAAALRWTPLSQYANKEWLIGALEELRGIWWAPLVLLALYAVLPPLGFPVSPMIIASAVVFGVFWGSVYNYLGCIIGASISYEVARGLGRSFIEHIAGDRLKRAEKLIDRHGFWSLVRLRFLPVPFPLVNFGAALVGVRRPSFHLATAIGHILPIPIWTYFWVVLFGAAAGEIASAGRNLFLAMILFLTLSFAPRWWQRYKRRKRLEELREMRRGQLQGRPDPED